jgi:hypothetical protein
MITTQTALALAKSLRPDGQSRHRRRKPNEGKTFQSNLPERIGDARTDGGLDIETKSSRPPVKAEVFS